jgi:hypothetical protein
MGRVKKNVLPLSCSLSTHISPPCAATIPRAMASPSPAPPSRERFACQKRSNTCGRSAEDAQVKLDEGKFADAVGKLTDFRQTVIALRDAAKPKLSADDAQKLLDAVDVAIACLNALE